MNGAELLLPLGLILLLGVIAEIAGRRTAVPRVTLLLIAGVVVGPAVLGWVQPLGTDWFTLVSQVALTMVCFLLGGRLSRENLRENGRDVVGLSLAVVIATFLVVLAAVWIASGDLVLALILSGLATATAPAATSDVVREDQAMGPFADRLLGIVTIDDAWGIALFSVLMSLASMLIGLDGAEVLRAGAWEVGGAVLLGAALGFPIALVTGRIAPGEPTLVEALGVVFICLGAALWLEVSFLLASVVLGAVVANFARHHDRPFHEIEHIEWPFLLVFFVLAGAALELRALAAAGAVGFAYILSRTAGRLVGGWFGSRMRRLDAASKRWLGAALLPQAGVAVGMGLVAAQRFPGRADTILSVVLASTVLFELVGPPMTRLALRKSRA